MIIYYFLTIYDKLIIFVLFSNQSILFSTFRFLIFIWKAFLLVCSDCLIFSSYLWVIFVAFLFCQVYWYLIWVLLNDILYFLNRNSFLKVFSLIIYFWNCVFFSLIISFRVGILKFYLILKIIFLLPILFLFCYLLIRIMLLLIFQY